MGAPTDSALQLARDIAAYYADESDSDIPSWAWWQILGAWRLAMRLDHEAAGPALAEFLDIAGRPKKTDPSTGRRDRQRAFRAPVFLPVTPVPTTRR